MPERCDVLILSRLYIFVYGRICSGAHILRVFLEGACLCLLAPPLLCYTHLYFSARPDQRADCYSRRCPDLRGPAHETLIWASRARGARHTFNYDLINASRLSSVWRIHTVPRREKVHGYHPTQKPLRLVRRALLASTREGALVLDPFTGSGTTGVAAKELDLFFVGAELEREFCELAGRRIEATVRGSVLREIFG